MLQKRTPIPHLIHIGFPKCASTFMQQWFAEHPQVAYKAGVFGGSHGVADLIASVLAAPGPAICNVTSDEKLSHPRDPATFSEIDTTPIEMRNAAMERVCLELAARFPNASILIITRNQADMIVSGYSQMITQGGHLREADIPRYQAEGFRDLHPFDFERALKLYRNHFGGRVLALPFELLVDDRQGFLAHVADFMGVEHFDIAADRVNPSLDGEQLYWYPQIASLLQRAPSAWLRSKLVGLHRWLISIGAWRPLLNVLKLITGPKNATLTLSPEMKRRLETDCEELLRSELYAPYRKLYRGSASVPDIE